MSKHTLKNQFDPIDHRIMEELTSDARIAYSALAQKLNVSNSLVHQRIKKLEESGVLRSSHFQLDASLLGYETIAFTQIMISHVRYIDEIIDILKEIPEIVECLNTAGRYAIVVKIFAVNNTHLRDLIYEKIQSIKGVEATNTIFTFDTAFNRPVALELSKEFS